MLSQGEEIKIEFKTIRMRATSYYKLVELTGMMNALTGINFSISDVASFLTDAIYQSAYPGLVKLMNDPQALQKNKEQFQQGVKQIYDLFKNVKIKE